MDGGRASPLPRGNVVSKNRAWVPSYPDSERYSAVDEHTRVPGDPGSAFEPLRQGQVGTPVATPAGMPSHLHLVRDDSRQDAPAASPTADDPALRPTSFDDYVGQSEVVENLRESVRAAKRGGWQLDHMLFAGPAGLGKTSLAGVIAAELGGKLHVTSAPAIEHKGALAALLTALAPGDILFIDELHALRREIAEMLYTAMEDRVLDMAGTKKVIRIPLPKFTLLGATTHAGKLPKPLLDRFGFVWQLRPYTLPEMTTIVARSAGKLAVAVDEEGAIAVARASRGTPRIANRLLRRVRDVAANAAADGALVVGGLEDMTCASGTINGPLAVAALAKLGIDHLGLDPLDRRYLALVADRPVGIEAICAELAEDKSTIEDAVEPFLMQAGLIKRGGKGRLATEAGRDHLAEVAS
jgi:Holliday junction DNA helicase RuvB